MKNEQHECVEMVLCAANWYPDLVLPHAIEGLAPVYWLPQNIGKGVVYAGRHHLECMYQCYQTFGLKQSEILEYQGFLTSHNRWVTRKEGAHLAFEAKQIEKCKDYLFSEDLWNHPYPLHEKREVPDESERF